MEIIKLSEMTKGWFIGDFTPSILKREEFEVGIHELKKAEVIKCHKHKIALEITVIISGKLKMNEKILEKGDIMIIQPNEYVFGKALEKTTTLVVKTPSVPNDKYFKDKENK